MSRGSITTRTDLLFFGCRRMIIPVQTFSSEWLYVCRALMHFHGFSISRWTFFSEQDPTKCVVRNASSSLVSSWRLLSSHFSGNVKWVSSITYKASHLLITNECSFVNKSTAFANGLVSVQGDGKVIMKADDTSNLANGVFRDRWVLVILFEIFGFLEGTFFWHLVCEFIARQHTIMDCLY